MRLNKDERRAFEFLHDLAEAYLGDSVEELCCNKSDFNNLKKIGVTIETVNHRRVKATKVGKSEGLNRRITDAPWYIRGKNTAEYLPFQVKEYKDE